MVANGAPIISQYIFKNHLSVPVDMGKCFFDGEPVFGNSKTWRGLFSSLVLTSLFASLLGYDYETGLIISLCSMMGDLFSSFIKRRMSIKPSDMSLFLDQVPESLLPALFMMNVFNLNVSDVVILVAIFMALELLLSRILYQLKIRKRPY